MSDRNLHIVVLAGGKGTRFWPLSTQARPKQFLTLFGERSLLQNAVDRVVPLVDAARVWISTDASLVGLAREQLPEIAPERFIVEPVGRNTLPCIALACGVIREADPEAVVAIVYSDHLIRRTDEFRAVLSACAEAAVSTGELVVVGVRPTRAETGYGYIRVGERRHEVNGIAVHRSEGFTEKPVRERAEAFVSSGDHMWNCGMFLWTTETFFEALAAHQPEMARQVAAMVAKPDSVATVYPTMERMSVDFGLMEHATNTLVVPADLGWDDVGNWESVWAVWERDADDNAVRGEHIGADTRNCLIFGDRKPMVTLGLDGLIVVETDDAVLVCPRDRAQEIRELAERFAARNAD